MNNSNGSHNKAILFNDFIGDFTSHKLAYQGAINKVLSSGWYILGKEVKSFENNFAKNLGTKHCIGVGNGLEALQISLMALGIGSDDEVVTTPLSAVATTLAIIATGATPVFVDTNQNGQIDPKLIPSAITEKTKAILPVHLYGQSVDIDQLKEITQHHHLALIEDACQAHGSSFNGQKLGTFGELGCFSFYPTKNLGAFGDGGAIVTNSDELAQKCRTIRDYGQKGKYNHEVYGLNSRLDELHASVLSVKLKFLDQNNKKRSKLAKRYTSNLSSLSSIRIITPVNNGSNFHLFVIATSKRNQLRQYLKKYKIDTDIHYPSLIPSQPFIKKQHPKTNLPVAQKLTQEILSLPCHPRMNLNKIDYISRHIAQFSSVT